MKTTKRLFFIFVLIIFCLSIVACGKEKPCESHTDSNSDEICDQCGAELETKKPEGQIQFIKNGEVKFQIVLESGIAQTVRNHITAKANALEQIGLNLAITSDREDTVKEGVVDVIIGDIISRGEKFRYDSRKLGPKGEAIMLLDGKVIIAGGTEDTLLEVIDEFFEKFIGLEEDTVEIKDASVKIGKFFENVQTDYRLTSFTVNGNDIKDYVIVWDSSIPEHENAALLVQNTVYDVIGYWLEIKDASTLESVPEEAVVIKRDVSVKNQGGFKVYVDGKQLVIASAYDDKAEVGLKSFLNSNVKIKEGELNLQKKLSYTQDYRYIYYSDFGAVGLGEKTENDFLAIKAAHEYANKYGYIVKADPGAKYYIGRTGKDAITIKTDVLWGDATFIIDDSEIGPSDPERSASLFRITSNYSRFTHNSNSELVKKINQAIADSQGTLDFTKLTNFFDYAPGHDVMILPYDNTHKVYIRYGGNANSGSDQHEVIVLDKDGNIDKDTPFLLNYNHVSSIIEVRIDDEPITVSGGVMITIANQAPSAYTYYNRNFTIQRSNVTIRGLEHRLQGEGDTGAPYSGFIGPSYANNLLVENCIFQAHRWYWNADPATGGATSMGTYELGGSNANKLYYRNCIQSNYFDKNGNATSTWYDEDGNTGKQNVSHQGDGGESKLSGIWGVMGTNYCKNITYDGCTLNRLDAHAGVYNASIINGSNVKNINLIGGGTALIKDSTIHNASMLTLRSDYGSTWNGEIVIDNVKWVTSEKTPTIISGGWSAHYFGYTTYLPTVVRINDLEINGPATSVKVFSNYGSNDDISDPNLVIGYDDKGVEKLNPNPLVYSEKIVITNCGSMPFVASSPESTFNRIPIVYDEEE